MLDEKRVLLETLLHNTDRDGNHWENVLYEYWGMDVGDWTARGYGGLCECFERRSDVLNSSLEFILGKRGAHFS